MTEFLLYIARSGLYLGVFYAFYLLVMRRTTFFRFNRCALLLGSVVCALLPLLRVRTYRLLATAGPLTIASVDDASQAPLQGNTVLPDILPTVIYAAGVLAVIAMTLISARRIRLMAKGGRFTRRDGFRTVIPSGNPPSFTFMRTIFIGERDLEEYPVIFSHESMHVLKRHYLDLFLFHIIQVLWWWNPLVWITRTELGLLHEYEADEAVIDKGIDATQYQLLLVRKSVGEQRFSLASGFRHAKLKNRIAMMFKPSSHGWMRLSYLALIPVLAALVFACNPSRQSAADPESAAVETKSSVAGQDTSAEPEEVPYMLTEVKPTFRGGDANTFAKWVNENLHYPETAKAAQSEGRVMIGFTVDSDGYITDVSVLRSVHPDLDAEAVRAISSCKEKWTPGMQDGKPVRVRYTFPVIFKLN